MRNYYEMLRRTAAILLALAVIAERAANRSRPVRWLVLWILQRAEAVASAYVAEIDPLAIEYSSSKLMTATTRQFALPQCSACSLPRFSHWRIRPSFWRTESLPNNPLADG